MAKETEATPAICCPLPGPLGLPLSQEPLTVGQSIYILCTLKRFDCPALAHGRRQKSFSNKE